MKDVNICVFEVSFEDGSSDTIQRALSGTEVGYMWMQRREETICVSEAATPEDIAAYLFEVCLTGAMVERRWVGTLAEILHKAYQRPFSPKEFAEMWQENRRDVEALWRKIAETDQPLLLSIEGTFDDGSADSFRPICMADMHHFDWKRRRAGKRAKHGCGINESVSSYLYITALIGLLHDWSPLDMRQVSLLESYIKFRLENGWW